MKLFIFRTIITCVIVTLITTVFILLNFIKESSEVLPTFLFYAIYVFLTVLIYAVPSTILSEILSKSIMDTKKRLLIKSIMYFLAVSIFALQEGSSGFVIYAVISAIFYFIIDEIIRIYSNNKEAVPKG